MTKFSNQHGEITLTTGTGDISLAGSANLGGRFNFSANFANGETFPYRLRDGDDLEFGTGTYNSGPNTISRNPQLTIVSGIYDDSSPSAINLTSQAAVIELDWGGVGLEVELDKKANLDGSNSFSSLTIRNPSNPSLKMENTDGSVTAGEVIATWEVSHEDSTALSGVVAKIDAFAQGSFGGGAVRTALRFFTADQEADIGGVERMRVTSTGELLIDEINSLNGSGITVSDSLDFESLNSNPSSNLIISGGALTVTRNRHTVDTEAAAATDDLVTINGGVDGAIISISTVSSSRDVTLKHSTGNIFLKGAVDFTLANSLWRIWLEHDSRSGNWYEITRNDLT